MNLENQVCTLEQAIELKSMGIAQKSLFQWTIEVQKKSGEQSVQIMGAGHGVEVRHSINWRVYDFSKRQTFAAFTESELGIMLAHLQVQLKGDEITHPAQHKANCLINLIKAKFLNVNACNKLFLNS
jgi:hypothetical protein